MLKIIKKERKELVPIFDHSKQNIFDAIGIPNLAEKLQESADKCFTSTDSSASESIEVLMKLDKIEIAFLLITKIQELDQLITSKIQKE